MREMANTVLSFSNAIQEATNCHAEPRGRHSARGSANPQKNYFLIFFASQAFSEHSIHSTGPNLIPIGI
jgi:hypothetical protein